MITHLVDLIELLQLHLLHWVCASFVLICSSSSQRHPAAVRGTQQQSEAPSSSQTIARGNSRRQ